MALLEEEDKRRRHSASMGRGAICSRLGFVLELFGDEKVDEGLGDLGVRVKVRLHVFDELGRIAAERLVKIGAIGARLDGHL